MSAQNLAESVKRTVAVPGAFASTYPDTTDSLLVALVQDAYAEARLDRVLRDVSYDADTDTFTPALTPEQGALIVIYAAARFARGQYMNHQSSLRVKAGATEYETTSAATVAVEMLKQVQADKQALKDLIRRGIGEDTLYFMADAAYIQATTSYRTSSVTPEGRLS